MKSNLQKQGGPTRKPKGRVKHAKLPAISSAIEDNKFTATGKNPKVGITIHRGALG
jgi:hypothetical protein